jgi:hypothetical protein
MAALSNKVFFFNKYRVGPIKICSKNYIIFRTIAIQGNSNRKRRWQKWTKYSTPHHQMKKKGFGFVNIFK